MEEATEVDRTRELLRITYWVLTYSVMIAILIALVTDAMSHPHNGGTAVPRLVGLVLIGTLAMVWVWLSSLGKTALREMT